MKNVISFLEIQSFVIEKLQEFSIDEFYFGKHEYFIYNPNEIPKPNANKILNFLHEKFNVLDFCFTKNNIDNILDYYGEGNAYDTAKEKLLEYQNRCVSFNSFMEILEKENIILNDEQKQKMNEYFSDSFYNFKIWVINNLKNIKDFISPNLQNFDNAINEFSNQIEAKQTEIEKLNALQKEVDNDKISIIELEQQGKTEIAEIDKKIQTLLSLNDESFNPNIEELRKKSNQIFDNIEIQKKAIANKKEQLKYLETLHKEISEIEVLKEEKIQEKEICINKASKMNFEEELTTANMLTTFLIFKKIADFSYYSNDQYQACNERDYPNYYLFFERIYPTYSLVEPSEWKKELLEVLNQKIPKPLIFRIFDEKHFEKPKFATLTPELKYKQRGNEQKTTVIANIDDVFPIWYALKNALLQNEIIDNENNCSYLSLNNGIFTKIIVRKTNTTNENMTIALKFEERARYNNNPFYKTSVIFGGYTETGFNLLNGVYISYKDFIFEIDFFANALLLQSSNYFQQIQSISNQAKSDDISTQNSYNDYDD